MSDIQPLCASTPKKSRLSALSSNDSSYLFVSDSEDQDCSSAANASELLFITSEGDNTIDACDSITSKESESILFLSNDTIMSMDDAALGEKEESNCEESTLGKECCKEHCLQHFSIEEFTNSTQHFHSKSPTEQRQYLHDCLILSSPSGAATSSASKEKFMLYSKPLCKKAFAVLLGTSERRLDRIKQNFAAVGKIVHGNRGIKRPTTKSSDASAWMESYFSRMGDHMPDSNRIHLPSFLTKREVYQRMCTELSEDGIKEIISLSTFYELWDKNFSHVLIPEVS